MFGSANSAQVGDRFKRSGHSRKIYVVEQLIERGKHPRHARLIALESQESIVVGVSALLDGRLFQRVEV